MRLAHLADLHLGFTAYQRTNPVGANLRQADGSAAFSAAVDQIIAARVAAVLVAGDVFHSVRPANAAILAGFHQVRRLSEAGIPVVIVAGNHDTPRSVETSNILLLFEQLPHVAVVTHVPRRVRVGALNVTCLPHLGTGVVMPEVAPDPDAKWNVCLAHMALDEHGGTRPWADHRFDYVALGDYHVAHEVEPGVWYSGSTEYVSSNPWGEVVEQGQRGVPGKGWLLVDLRPGEWPIVEFQPIPTRKHLDLPVIDVGTRTPDDVALHMRANVQDVEIADAVVRQVLVNVPRGFQKLLDHEAVRSFQARALYYRLDCRRLAGERKVVTAALVARAATLSDLIEEALNARPLTDNVDREGLKALARKYMGEAEEQAVPVRESLVA